MYIELNHLISLNITCVRNRKPNYDFVLFLFRLHFLIPETGIRQSITKRIQYLSIKILIGPFALNNIVIVDIRQILILPVPGHGKACCRIHTSAQYCRNTGSKLLRAGCGI